MLWSDISQEKQGGFINAATGAFSPDPTSVMVFDSVRGLDRTPDPPYLYARGPGDVALAAASYDAALHRWLPVPREWVSPDGARYAYAAIQPGVDQGVHIVTVATGTDRVIPGTSASPDPRGRHFSVVAYQPEGVYLSRGDQLSGVGLWLLNPSTGAITQMSTDSPVLGTFVAGKEAWWSTVTPDPAVSSDPHVVHQYLSGAAGQHAETWFERPGFRLHVLGVAAGGRALVVAQTAGTDELWLLANPGSWTLVAATPNDGSVRSLEFLPYKTAVADSAVWWIGARTGVFFFADGDFVQVSTAPAVVVGGCA